MEKIRVLVFGNPIAKIDSAAVKIAEKLAAEKNSLLENIEFVRFDTSEDLEKEGRNLVIMDAVVGLSTPRLVELFELELPENPLSVHGFDLIWNLMLLKKIGRLDKATIIGVPARKPVKESLPKTRRLLEKITKKR